MPRVRGQRRSHPGREPQGQHHAALGFTVFGERFEKFGVPEARPQDYEFGKMFWDLSCGLLASGKIRTAPVEVNLGGKGLEGVLVGLQELKGNKVSGAKLVYTI